MGLVAEIAHVKVGYFKVKADRWPSICAAIAKPWPVEAVGADLAWWQDQRRMQYVERIPSHRVLAERWGWTEWQARRAMQQLGDLPAQEATNRDERTARAAVSSRQQEERMDLSGMSRFDDEDREREEAARSTPESVQPVPAVDLAAEVERRVAERLREEESEARIAEERRRLAMLGSAEVQATLLELEKRDGAPLPPGDVKAVRERIRQGTTGEEILLVDQWVRKSGHSEAEYLRANEYGAKTVLNERFPKRLALARAWQAGAEQTRPEPRPRQQSQPRASTRGLMALAVAQSERRGAPPPQIAQAAPPEVAPPPPARAADRLLLSAEDEAFFRGDL